MERIPARRRELDFPAGASERQRLRGALERAAPERGGHRTRGRETATRLPEDDRVESRSRGVSRDVVLHGNAPAEDAGRPGDHEGERAASRDGDIHDLRGGDVACDLCGQVAAADGERAAARRTATGAARRDHPSVGRRRRDARVPAGSSAVRFVRDPVFPQVTEQLRGANEYGSCDGPA